MADDQNATDSAPEGTPAREPIAPAEPGPAAPESDATGPEPADAAPEPTEPAEPNAADAEPADIEPRPTVSAGPSDDDTRSTDAEPTRSAEPSAVEPEPTTGAEPSTKESAVTEPSTELSPAAEPESAAAESGPELPDPGSDAADSPGSAESDADKPAIIAPTGTTPAWWTWVSRHGKPVALVAGLVVVAVVATVVTISVTAAGPKDVVQSYMDAIHAGDVEAALEIAGEPKDDNRLEFLSADALADDWSVGPIVERHRRDEEADVDVTITAGDVTQQGRFHVVKGEDGWTIEAPFVAVELQVAGVSTVELGDVEQAVTLADPGGTVPLRVFPGVYDLYPGRAKQVTFDPGVLIAAPVPSADQQLRFAAEYTLTRDGAAVANGAIADRVTECATRTTTTPDGCPFSGENQRALYGFSSITNVSWAVTRMPDAGFVPDVGGPRMVLRKPGLATLSGSGVPYESETDEPEPFTVTCEFGVDNLAVAITKDGLAVNGAVTRPYAAVESTHCF